MRGQPFTYLDFSGGLNLEAAPYLLDPSQSQDCYNVHTNEYGQLRKREGCQVLATLTEEPTALVNNAHSLFAPNVAGDSFLIAVGMYDSSHDGFYRLDTNGDITDITPAGDPFSDDTRWYFAQAEETSGNKGPIFAMNGVDDPQEWDGVAANTSDWTADSGTLPNGKYLTYHGNRLWCAVGSRLRYSGITGTSPDTGNWDTNNYVDLDPEDGQEITAVAPFGAYLIVFKPRKIFVVMDLVTGENRMLSNTVGCIAHRSCVETPQGLFFLDEEQGIMVTDGNQINRLSGPIQPVLREAGQNSPTIFRRSAAVYHDDRYYISIAQFGGSLDTTLEFDLKRSSWWIHSFGANQFALLDPQGAPVLYMANAQTFTVDRAFAPQVYTDNDVPYSSYWRSSEFIWNAPHVQKRVAEVRVDGFGEWVLRYHQDYSVNYLEDAGIVWGTNVEDPILFAPSVDDGLLFAPDEDDGEIFAPPNLAVVDRRYYTLGFARAWSFMLYSEDASDFQIYSMTVSTIGRTD